jgi:hypothetical protein
MPYRSKEQDRQWHKDRMRERRRRIVTPVVTPKVRDATPNKPSWVDADGNPVFDD